MQIRLTVLAPRGGHAAGRSCDVLVTAPAGTALAAVAAGIATAVAGSEAPATVLLYAGRERLDLQRRTLGEPPLIDGAVLSLQVPNEADVPTEDAPAQLHVVAGPDAGGVHLLHGGQIRIGRSAEAEVPLDDPDVSRLHCAVTVAEDGGVTVADLRSTNGTTLEGAPVGGAPVRLAPGALLRIGESALRLTGGARPAALATASDGEGHLRLTRPGTAEGAAGPAGPEGADRADRAEGRDGPGRSVGAGGTDGSRTGGSGASGSGANGSGTGGSGTGGSGSGGAGDLGPGGAPAGVGEPLPGGGTQGSAPGGLPYGTEDPAPGGAGRHAGSRTAGTYDPGRPPAGAGPGAAPGTPPRIPGRRYERGRYDAEYESAYDGQSGSRPEYGGSQFGNPPGAPRVPAPRAGDPQTATHATGIRATGPLGAGSPGTGPDPRTADTHHGGRSPLVPRDGAQPGPARPGPAHAGPAQGAPESPYAIHDSAHSRAQAAGQGTDPAAYEEPRAHSRTPGSRRQETPTRGTEAPDLGARRSGRIGAWARRLAGGRGEERAGGVPGPAGPGATGRGPTPETWPDPATVLLTALGPGPRLWERGGRHPEALAVRLGTADRPSADGTRLPLVPVTVGLREAGSLGLAGPRERLLGAARWAVAQLAALHAPAELEIVLISADRARSLPERTRDWGWLGWLPHVRPGHGQECRLLLAYDREQAAARTEELTRRLDEGVLGTAWASADPWTVTEAAARHDGPYTLVVVDGDPGSAALRETTARLAGGGAAAGIHLLCLAETESAAPHSPVTAVYEAACAASPPFRDCGAVALLSGDVATGLRLLRTAVGQPAGHGTLAVVDAVSAAWAERFGRALAPLRAAGSGRARPVAALPRSARLLDELGLARATPASLMARWASAADRTKGCTVVLGAGPHGPVGVDLTEEGPHLLIEGPPGSGRTELLRSIAASLGAAARPDQLGLLLVDGAGGAPGEGLSVCTELPHVTEHLVASDPVRMRQFAQALGGELKRRAEVLGRLDFAEWHSGVRELHRPRESREPHGTHGPHGSSSSHGPHGSSSPHGSHGPRDSQSAHGSQGPHGSQSAQGSHGSQSAHGSPGAAGSGGPLPRLVVLVDGYDALVAPSLGSPGRPSAGSVVRALEAVAREGERLGVHLVAASACPEATVDTELAQGARLRVVLDAPPAAPAPDDPSPGRGRLGHPDGRVTPFQGGRVTGRIPRTGTLRPTVTVVEWERMGDPPARRPVRELGNGPTDLALLASALERAARSVDAVPLAPLTPAHT
ncbi:FHA domain-containing protein [Streptomyces sp. NPDC093085]|uniref:FHA domain-containing protein n=1 Tax=Streptomyces sp. NPDC093085 TaxID=3155068 RepID=UPI0034407BC2